MAFITRKITRTSQPQELVGIDWRNPLTNELAGCLLAGRTVDLASNESASVSNLLVVESGLSAVTTAPGIPIGLSTPRTMVFVGNILSSTGSNPNFCTADGAYWSSSSNNGGFYFYRVHTSSKISIGAWNNNSLELVGPVHPIGKPLCISGVFASGTLTGYIDGVSFGAKAVPAGIKPGNGLFNSGSVDWGETTGQLGLIFHRGLSAAEIKSLSDNPWQIFEPIEETICIPDGVSVTLPTLVQPTSTTSAGAWTATGAATLHEAIDEATYSDADYISVAAASTCELVLADSAFPTGNVSLAYRALSSTGDTLTVTLKQGATTIMTRTHALTGTATLYTQALTAGEVAAIVAGPITCTLTSS